MFVEYLQNQSTAVIKINIDQIIIILYKKIQNYICVTG